MATPVAVVEIRSNGMRVVPVIDVNRLIGRVCTAAFGFAFALLVVRAVTGEPRSASRRGVSLLPARLARWGTEAPQRTVARCFAHGRRDR
jgi:hypothetical protein